MKRCFDVLGALLGLVFLAPLFAILGALVRFGDGGRVFFGQTRVGQLGCEFRMWKFRTMVEDAQSLGPPLTVDGDPRITPVGRWLRKLKLDELPQLWNVLIGEMSLVGPRPEVPKYVALYTDDQRKVLQLKPGITDPASLEYFREGELLLTASDPQHLYVSEIMPKKIRINLRYAERAGVALDAAIVIRTVLRLLAWNTACPSDAEPAFQDHEHVNAA